MTLFRNIVPALLCATATFAATGALAASDKDFRDWWAACDNLRNCSAYGFEADSTGAGVYLRIARGGAPAARAKITVAIQVDDGITFKLGFDDPALPGLPADALKGEDNEDNDLRRADISGGGDTLIGSLRKAKDIVVTRIDPPGKKSDKVVSRISLNGAVAAMLWIDEQQKRLDTTTALIKRGDKPESSIPPQPKAPVIVAAKGLSGAASDRTPSERDEAAIKKKAVRQCGADDEGELEDASALSTDTFIYSIRCPGGSGAYNYSFTFLIARAGQPQSARVPKFRAPVKTGDKQATDGGEEFLINPVFSNADMTITTFNKARGIGDCGDEERWIWDGKTFRLGEVRSMPHCRGVPSDDWPALYRAERRSR